MILDKKKYRLGDILIRQNIISESQLEVALTSSKKAHKRLGDYLVESGTVADEDIALALHYQLGIEKVELRGIKLPQEVIGIIPGSVLRKHSVLPIGFDESKSNVLILAMADPLDMTAQDDISIITNCLVEPRVSTHSAIHSVLDKYFGTDEAMSAAEKYTKGRELQAQAEAAAAQEDSEVTNAPIVQLVKSIIEQAVRQRASDIHFDAMEKQVRVRYRIDGILVKKMVYDISLLPAIVTRIKIIADMDISEKRKPQDGRITLIVDRTEYDIRVSILPSSYGEKIVMRLTSSTALTRDKGELGLREWEMKRFDRILSAPNGIILITGPTGSGKSTTLYTALSELNDESLNIVTVEDPVEANIAGINQVQVNVKAELTFATALRSILRQDPDIIMIGEIRDVETAAIAVQASITGHLVVSTLHTNSASSTITRLLDMGIEPYLLADSLSGIIAQRLVRRLCNSCKVERQATEAEKHILGVSGEVTLYEPGACHLCSETGYYGRIGVYEIMDVSPSLKQAISERQTTDKIREIALSEGMNSLKSNTAQYVLDGVTSIHELMKISIEE